MTKFLRPALAATAALATALTLAACSTDDSSSTNTTTADSTTKAAATQGDVPADIAGTYELDPAHSEIGFTVKHAMVSKVRGDFTDFNSSFTVNKDGSGTVEATIKTASVNTNNEERDEHVRSDDFFAVDKFPDMTFKADFSVPGASSVDDLEGTTFPVTGDLTLKGVTKQVTLDVTVDGLGKGMENDTRLGFTATGKLNRTDFGVDFNAPLESGGLLLSEDINLEIEGSAVKK